MVNNFTGRGSFQTSYGQEMDVAYPGKVVEGRSIKTYMNLAEYSLQEIILDVGLVSGDANATFKFDVPGVGSFEFLADPAVLAGAAPTTAEVIDGLLAAYGQSGDVGRAFIADKTATPSEIKLTGRFPDQIFKGITFTGGANVSLVNTDPTQSDPIGYGLIVVTKPTYPDVDGIQTISLPTAAGDSEVGLTVADHGIPRTGGNEVGNGGVGQYRNQDPVGVMDDGVGYVLSEVAISPGDSLFYRHTADGAFTVKGAIANAAGTGLRALPLRTTILRKSEQLSDGLLITLVDFK